MNRAAIKEKARRAWLWLRPLIAVVVVLTTFRSAVADWNDVPTGSMKPTILEGDRIWVNKLAYGVRLPFTRVWLWQNDGPRPGDVVVCLSPEDGTRLVKRVIAAPGDTVEMRNNQLVLNGRPVEYEVPDADPAVAAADSSSTQSMVATETLHDHPHAMMVTPGKNARRTFAPIRVPEGKYVLLGDNRDDSRDSRWFGLVDRGDILGRAGRVLFSLDHQHYHLPRWSRFLHPLQ